MKRTDLNLKVEDIKTFCKALETAKKVCIASHLRPDGDAIGSVVAMRRFVSAFFNAESRIVTSDSFPGTLSFITKREDCKNILSYDKSPETVEQWISDSDLIICLDCSGFSRTGSISQFLSASKAFKVLIDHHLNPAREEFDLVFSTIEISSASEVLFNILKVMPQIGGDIKKLPHRVLYALMSGMTTDTNNLSNSVFPSTLSMCSELLEAGVDRDDILLHVYNEYSEARLRTMGYLLSAKLTICRNGVAYMILHKEEIDFFKIKDGELEGMVNLPLAVKNVRMSIFLREDDGFFRVSIRSKRGTSANRCAMQYFNGGGHELASGGRLYFPADIQDKNKASDYIERVTSEMFGE